MLKKEMLKSLSKRFEKKQQGKPYETIPSISERPLMNWELLFGKEMVIRDGSVASTNHLLQSKQFVGLYFSDFGTKTATSLSLPLANSLMQYYSHLKEINQGDQLEVVSIDINDSMNVTYSRYYLDFPWLVIDVSNQLLRKSLVHDYYTSTTIPQFVLLNRYGKVIDREAHLKIEQLATEKNSLEDYYDLNANMDEEYDVYASYNVDEPIPALPGPLQSPVTRNLAINHEDTRISSDEENQNIFTGARNISIDIDRKKSDTDHHKSKRLSVPRQSVPSYEDEKQQPNQNPPAPVKPHTDEPRMSKVPQIAEAKSNLKVASKKNVIPIITLDLTTHSLDLVRVKQLLQLIGTLPPFRRTTKYVESAVIFWIINARTEVELIDLIIQDIQDQQVQQLIHLPSITADEEKQKKQKALSILEIKERIRNYERILSRLTYNQQFPSYQFGFPNATWERDICAELKIHNGNWEKKLLSLQDDSEDISTIFTHLQVHYQEEYFKYCIQLLQWSKIERVDREAIAKKFEFFIFMFFSAICLCIPVVVGVVIGVYANQ